MAYDLEEQERIAAIKDWWDANRLVVIGLVVALVVGMSGYFGYQFLKQKSSVDAAQSFVEFEKTVKDAEGKPIAKPDAKLVIAAADALQTSHPSSFQASHASLVAAKVAFEAADLPAAQKQLEWVASKGVVAHRAIANIRLAAVLLDSKKYEDALKTLDQVKEESFAGQAQDLKGDVLAAQGRVDEARAAYKAAIEKGGERFALKAIVTAKMDSLPAPVTVAAAPAAPATPAPAATPAASPSTPAVVPAAKSAPATPVAPVVPETAKKP